MLQPTYVTSSTIECIGHHLNKLYVKFKTGVTYSYDDCPFAHFVSLKEVESAGKFFSRNIRSKFKYTKLPDDPFSGEILT
jgi:hypothetical protein